MGVLSPDGMSKTFDDSANGYVRAEAAAAIYMQRAKDSRRIYAQVYLKKSSSSNKTECNITMCYR